MTSLSWMFRYILALYGIFGLEGHATTITVGLLGYQNDTNDDIYQAIADEITGPTPACQINFENMEFVEDDGQTVFESLNKVRAAFGTKKIAVAIGPWIDGFTSPTYVIRKQAHLMTSMDHAVVSSIEAKGRILPILPDFPSLSTTIAEFASAMKWQNVALLSEEDFSPVLSLGRYSITVWPMRLPKNLPKDLHSSGDNELRRLLIPLRESRVRHIILHSMNRDIVDIVIHAANRLHLLYSSLEWLITYPDFEDIISSNEKTLSGRIFGFQILRPERIPEPIRANFSDSFTRIQMAIAVDAIGLVYNVLENTADCSKDAFSQEQISPFQFIQTIQTKQKHIYSGALGTYHWDSKAGNARTNYTLDVLLHEGKMKKITECFFENSECEMEQFKIPYRRSNGNKVFATDETIRIVTMLNPPFVMYDQGKYVGFSVDLLNLIAKKLHFKYQLYEDPDGTFGEIRNGKWRGMVRQLQTGNASLAMGAFAVTSEREEMISFSYAILSTSTSLLVRKPAPQWNFFQFLWPFSTLLWLMIVAFFLIVGTALYLMSKYDETQTASVRRFDLKESMWYSLNVLLMGATEYPPQTTCTRSIIAFYWFCILVINAAYTANLAAFLTLRQIDNRIKTVQDLSRQTSVHYGVQKGSDLELFFNNTREDPYERMYTFMRLTEDCLLENVSKHLPQVQAGEFIFLADGIVNEYYAATSCGIESIEQTFGAKQFAIGFPKGAPYRDEINRAILELKEAATIDQLKQKWLLRASNFNLLCMMGCLLDPFYWGERTMSMRWRQSIYDDVLTVLIPLIEIGPMLQTWLPTVGLVTSKTWWASTKWCPEDSDQESIEEKETAELSVSNMFGVFIVLVTCIIFAIIFEIWQRCFFCYRNWKDERHAKAKAFDTIKRLRWPNIGYLGWLNIILLIGLTLINNLEQTYSIYHLPSIDSLDNY